jgi:hypothetical protein
VAHSRALCFKEGKYPLSLPGVEPWVLCHPVCSSLVTIMTRCRGQNWFVFRRLVVWISVWLPAILIKAFRWFPLFFKDKTRGWLTKIGHVRLILLLSSSLTVMAYSTVRNVIQKALLKERIKYAAYRLSIHKVLHFNTSTFSASRSVTVKPVKNGHLRCKTGVSSRTATVGKAILIQACTSP